LQENFKQDKSLKNKLREFDNRTKEIVSRLDVLSNSSFRGRIHEFGQSSVEEILSNNVGSNDSFSPVKEEHKSVSKKNSAMRVMKPQQSVGVTTRSKPSATDLNSTTEHVN
jgi:hypothetical protein